MVGPPMHVLSRRLGQRVKGRYRLTEVIGVGGQGAVYAADDLVDRDRVAVKILHDELSTDPAARERMIREARALMVLSGTAALDVLDQGFTEDGHLALVTELLEGEELEDHLLRIEKSGEHLPASELLRIFTPVADTLARAHELGIVHRDLKPANVFLVSNDPAKAVRLMDFGFAKFHALKALTITGFVAGSPTYLAPEAWREQPTTPLMDVYGFGAMLFRVLAGHPPFRGAPIEIYRACTRGPRPSLHALRPDLPAEIDDWVEMALAADPEQRFQNPKASLSALCGLLA